MITDIAAKTNTARSKKHTSVAYRGKVVSSYAALRSAERALRHETYRESNFFCEDDNVLPLTNPKRRSFLRSLHGFFIVGLRLFFFLFTRQWAHTLVAVRSPLASRRTPRAYMNIHRENIVTIFLAVCFFVLLTVTIIYSRSLALIH